MGERLLGCHVLQLVARAAAKRATRGGEDERVDRFRRAALEALKGGRVLAVDRDQPTSPTLPGFQCELARSNEALLVRKRELHTALERPQRRREAREADDRVEHEVGLGVLEQLGQVAADLRERSEAVDRL